VRRTTERQTPRSFATARFFLCIQYVLGSGRLGRAAPSRSSAVHALRAARSRKSFQFLALREPAWSVSPLREASHEAVLYVRLVCSVMAGLGQRVVCARRRRCRGCSGFNHHLGCSQRGLCKISGAFPRLIECSCDSRDEFTLHTILLLTSSIPHQLSRSPPTHTTPDYPSRQSATCRQRCASPLHVPDLLYQAKSRNREAFSTPDFTTFQFQP
jgi:hypothetical protein